MSEPFLYLEDLVKAEAPATPKPSSKAKALAAGPAKVGGGSAPPAQRTLSGARPTPAASPKAANIAKNPAAAAPPPKVSEGAKALGGPSVKLEYWSGKGTPPAEGGWSQTASGAWARPEGSGAKGGTGEAENLVSEMAVEGQKDETTKLIDEITSQEPQKKLVSSSGESAEKTPASSSAAKIEEAKQATAPPPVSEGARKVSDEKKAETKDPVKEKKENSKALAGHLSDVAEHMKNEKWDKVDSSMEEAYKLRDQMSEPERTKLDEAMQQVAAKKAKAEDKSENKQEKKPGAAEPVTSFEGELSRDSHKQSARELSENIRANLEGGEMDDATRKQLEKVADELDKHGEIEDMPTDSQKKILSLGKKLAGAHGKKPKEDKVPKEEGVAKKPPTNYASVFDRGRAAGEQVGAGAASLEGGGGLASSAINYGSSGAVRGGQHLLSGSKDKEAAETAVKAPKKGAEVGQSSMQTEKSLGLYINLDLDLVKAVQSPNIGGTTPTESRAKIQHESSYAKRPVGVANEGIVTEDDPDKGKQWKHDDKDAVETSVNEKLKADEEGEEEEEETTEETTEKALGHNPIEFLKSLNTEVHEELSRVLPNDTESMFMVDVLGYDPAIVSKGQATITGKDRHRFNEWAQARLYKSIASLNERIVTK